MPFWKPLDVSRVECFQVGNFQPLRKQPGNVASTSLKVRCVAERASSSWWYIRIGLTLKSLWDIDKVVNLKYITWPPVLECNNISVEKTMGLSWLMLQFERHEGYVFSSLNVENLESRGYVFNILQLFSLGRPLTSKGLVITSLIPSAACTGRSGASTSDSSSLAWFRQSTSQVAKGLLAMLRSQNYPKMSRTSQVTTAIRKSLNTFDPPPHFLALWYRSLWLL